MYNAENFMVNDKTMSEIRRETARAIQKHGREQTPLSDSVSRPHKLAILMEEVGEVAKIINEFNLGNLSPQLFIAELKKEIVQVSAVAAMWFECETNIGG